MNPRLRRGGRNHNHNNNNNNNHNHNNNIRRNNNITRNTVLDSMGPAGKLRGTAYQLMEKYLAAAKDFMSSDRILAENCLQHAEHYMRLNAFAMAQENQNRFNNNPQQRPQQTSGDAENNGDADSENRENVDNTTVTSSETIQETCDDVGCEETVEVDYAKMDLSIPISLMSEKAAQKKRFYAPSGAAPTQVRRPSAPTTEKTPEAAVVAATTPAVEQKRRGRPAKKKIDIVVS